MRTIYLVTYSTTELFGEGKISVRKSSFMDRNEAIQDIIKKGLTHIEHKGTYEKITGDCSQHIIATITEGNEESTSDGHEISRTDDY